MLDAELSAATKAIGAEALATVHDAGVAPESVEQVVFVGGSSLLQGLRSEMAARLPDACQEDAAVFTAVAHGLALAAG